MGATHFKSAIPFAGRRHTDRTNRSLIATAAIVAIAALIACWFGTREVTNGIVNFEGRESARDWAISFSHSLSQANSTLPATALRPYSAATSPERFRALDNAMFEGEIQSYRLYAADGVIVASSAFEEIGKAVKDPRVTHVVNHSSSEAYVRQADVVKSAPETAWTATALAPLSRGPDTIGVFEVTVDVTDRAKQLNRLRYMAFGALAALLAAIFGILGYSISRTLGKQREAQQALALSERQHRRLLDDAPDSMVIHNLSEVLYVNAAAVALHGAASREELIGLNPIELVPEDKRAAVAEHRRMALSRGEIRTTESVGRRRMDGQVVETDSMGIPIDWDGQSCILIQSRDVTAQRADQRDIAEREAQVRAFMENTRSGMFIKDLSSRIVLMNRSCEEFYGVDRNDVLGMSSGKWLPAELAEEFDGRDHEVLSGGKALSYESVMSDVAGAERVIRQDLFPICKADGEILGIGGIFTDVSKIKEREERILKAQAEAEKAQAQLTAFFNHSPSGMYLKDRDRKITVVNRAFEKFYGVDADNVIGKAVSEWMPKHLTDDIDTLDMELLRKGETMDMETDVRDADGEPRIVIFNKFPIFAPSGDVVGIGGVNTDVTAARRQEAEMRETQARLAAYIDHIPMMVLLMDRESRFLMVNSRYEAFFGVSAADLVGKVGHPGLSQEHHEMFLIENREICESQIPIDHVIEMRNAAGEARLLQQTKFPIVTGGGVPVAVGAIVQDITDQKSHERDLETARDDAEAANRAKSAFLANMSHEIRTPMNGVFGMADLLAQSSLSTDQRRYLDTIRRSGEALLGVINNVLDVSRVEAGEFQLDIDTFNLHDVIAEAIELFTESASSKDVFIAHNIAGNVPSWVEGDSVRLRQVLTNLVGNAIKFTRHGTIVVRATRVGGDAGSALIRFEVSDTGIGIEREQLASLFQPFQQADSSITRKFGGSGLGLSIAGHIVGLMGGRIDVDSVPGQGSSFVFSIPMAIDASATAPQRSDTGELSGKRLLIVDDNAVNLEILADFARDWDTEFIAVSNAEDAQTAIQNANRANTPFDIALIDIVMPKMDGIALAEWIGEHNGHGKTKLIGLTSFNWHHDTATSKSAGFCKFATKPIRRADLAQLIADALTDKIDTENDTPDKPDLTDTTAVPPGFSANVLLAEDNEVNQEIAYEYLMRLGCSVTVVENGHQAVDRFTNGAFDIVLMDVQMPEMDGIEATRRIRDIEAGSGGPRTPIIAATAHAFQEDREKCTDAGMDDFLSKPFTSKDIEPLLDRWLNQRPDSQTEPDGADGAEKAKRDETENDMLDRRTIAQLRSLDSSGEDRIFRKVAGVFIETTPPQIQQLQKHVTAQDCKGIMLIAHSLKTSCANVAALALSERFRALEHAALAEDIDTCTHLAGEVSGMYEDVATVLRRTAGIDAPNRRTG